MIVHPDTSFVLSLWHTGDVNWHIGAAWELGANYFATFDERQAEVARSVGFSTNL
jgi:hypothetical protein